MASTAAVLSLIGTILQGAQTAMSIGQDVKPFLDILKDLWDGDEITDATLAQAAARNDALHAELQAPLPPEEG